MVAKAISNATANLSQGLSDFSINEGKPVVSSNNYSPSESLTLGDITLRYPGILGRSNGEIEGTGNQYSSLDVSAYSW
jgi:hypothetical protein